jgi:hypothetical protein
MKDESARPLGSGESAMDEPSTPQRTCDCPQTLNGAPHSGPAAVLCTSACGSIAPTLMRGRPAMLPRRWCSSRMLRGLVPIPSLKAAAWALLAGKLVPSLSMGLGGCGHRQGPYVASGGTPAGTACSVEERLLRPQWRGSVAAATTKARPCICPACSLVQP